MILLDTNIIIPLIVSTATDHKEITEWFSKESEAKCTTSINLAETLRLITHPRVFAVPATLEAATKALANWISVRRIELLQESEDWLKDLESLSESLPDLKGNSIFDAQISLCARYNGVKKIATKDSDFAKFSFIDVINPIVRRS